MAHSDRAAETARPRAVTLQDVAREAGVAVSTVSRALSNPDRVSARTREHVHTIARRLAYRPNLIARALPSGRTGMLALLVTDITNPHHFGLIRGAEAQARAAGYTTILADCQGSQELESDHLQRLDSAVDGFVLASSRLAEANLQRLRGGRPVVLFNREADGFPSVVTDSVDGSRQVVEHLTGLGHRRLGYLAGPVAAWSDGRRWRALQAHAAATGAEITRMGPFSPTLADGPAAAAAGLSSGATALVAFNDLLAIGVLQQLERQRVQVPQQLSVVGFDDIFGAGFCHPPLSTVSSPAEDAGRALIDLLLGSAAPGARLVLPTRLTVRDSTGPPG
ncbi:MAG TPA: LacI family DNA-binding transcriptional regulator [Pseudonocardia sp.]|nr:LacI family DNA-binding transcriptional regulator [Pseudonocardia sp.]